MEKSLVSLSNLKLLPPKTSTIFDNADDLGKQACNTNSKRIDEVVIGKYFLPQAQNFQSVDSLVFPDKDTINVFEIRMAKQYEIKPGA